MKAENAIEAIESLDQGKLEQWKTLIAFLRMFGLEADDIESMAIVAKQWGDFKDSANANFANVQTDIGSIVERLNRLEESLDSLKGNKGVGDYSDIEVEALNLNGRRN